MRRVIETPVLRAYIFVSSFRPSTAVLRILREEVERHCDRRETQSAIFNQFENTYYCCLIEHDPPDGSSSPPINSDMTKQATV